MDRERSETAEAFSAVSRSEQVRLVLTEDGSTKQVSLRRPASGHVAVIDTLRFTVGEESFGGGLFGSAGRVLIDDASYSHEISRVLHEILGYGITGYTGHGGDFYLKTYTLGDGCGSVSMGGANQHATVLISITGTGCAAARDGWEKRLHDFLVRYGKRTCITRVDLAYDDLTGERVTVDRAAQWYDDGGFTCAVRAPTCEQRGNWRKPDGLGRSFYVGKRQNGKMCRVYEKGREQGDANSEWVRVEVELRSKDRVVPLDVLLDPSGYFCGAYPVLAGFAEEVTPQRVVCKQKSAEINVGAVVKHIRTSYGAYLSVLSDLYGSDELLQKVRVDDRYPRRLVVPAWESCGEPMHLWASAQAQAGIGSTALQ